LQKLEAKKQKIKELKRILQELEAENDTLTQAKMMHLKETDMGAAQIHQEMM
jgi:cell shape-determining protein MreC